MNREEFVQSKLDQVRKDFEDTMFKKYFIHSIRVNPNPAGMRLIVDPDIKDKAEFFEREKDSYKDEHLSAMWFAWLQAAARYMPDALRWDVLKKLAGYVQDDSFTTVTFDQDDATRSCIITVGKQGFFAPSFESALELAAVGLEEQDADGF